MVETIFAIVPQHTVGKDENRQLVFTKTFTYMADSPKIFPTRKDATQKLKGYKNADKFLVVTLEIDFPRGFFMVEHYDDMQPFGYDRVVGRFANLVDALVVARADNYGNANVYFCEPEKKAPVFKNLDEWKNRKNVTTPKYVNKIWVHDQNANFSLYNQEMVNFFIKHTKIVKK